MSHTVNYKRLHLTNSAVTFCTADVKIESLWRGTSSNDRFCSIALVLPTNAVAELSLSK